jgi:hypothetical protein
VQPAGLLGRPTCVRLLLLVPLLLLAACGSGDDDGDALASPPESLVVEQDLGDGMPAQRWTLECADPPSGDHPDPRAACAHLAAAADPFAPLPADQLCTEVYGGPQTARVTGTWQGRPVDLRVTRTDGCAIAQWDGLGPLLPGPVGVEPPQ